MMNTMFDQQMTLVPLMPKGGTVRFAVWHLLMTHPDGICRRDAVHYIDCYELSARIGELEADGWLIIKGRCTRHHHRQRFTLYSI